ncbi:unnamed protein product [Medioppia subpectinata]|uniref:C2H2-type domain-containing protein n=1 Tax=Medioppia subpectinata TaxID=1979941 RepID=A0A7R9Q3L7_9ACAR|nr:unnamed protein product [Medioppia subpectinata]CAG2111402.1 unnamed protein product [Medioppia subpectinata]
MSENIIIHNKIKCDLNGDLKQDINSLIDFNENQSFIAINGLPNKRSNVLRSIGCQTSIQFEDQLTTGEANGKHETQNNITLNGLPNKRSNDDHFWSLTEVKTIDDNNDDMNDTHESEKKTKAAVDEDDSDYICSEIDDQMSYNSDSDYDIKEDERKERLLCVRKKSNKKGRKSGTKHQLRADGLYECEYEGCGRVYSSLSSLYNHRVNHSSVKHPCDWVGCTATFNTNKAMRAHRRNRHGTDYKCDYESCTYTTGSGNSFRKHQSIHTATRSVLCPIATCRRPFRTAKHMNDHRLTRHPESAPEVAWIQCDDCPFRAKLRSGLEAHRRVHMQTFRCETCGVGFGRRQSLRDHVRKHDQTLRLRCEWPGCERTFLTDHACKAHLNTHTMEKVYRCHWPGCDSTFLNINTLGSHERRQHQGKIDYKCHWPGCDFGCTYKEALHRHMAKVHQTFVSQPIK